MTYYAIRQLEIDGCLWARGWSCVVAARAGRRRRAQTLTEADLIWLWVDLRARGLQRPAKNRAKVKSETPEPNRHLDQRVPSLPLARSSRRHVSHSQFWDGGFYFVCVIQLYSEFSFAKRYDFVCVTFGAGRGGHGHEQSRNRQMYVSLEDAVPVKPGTASQHTRSPQTNHLFYVIIILLSC